jgi:hypothetical protein
MEDNIEAWIGNYPIIDMEHSEILEKVKDTENQEYLLEGYWRTSFNGACSSSKSGVEIVFVSPKNIVHHMLSDLNLHVLIMRQNMKL